MARTRSLSTLLLLLTAVCVLVGCRREQAPKENVEDLRAEIDGIIATSDELRYDTEKAEYFDSETIDAIASARAEADAFFEAGEWTRARDAFSGWADSLDRLAKGVEGRAWTALFERELADWAACAVATDEGYAIAGAFTPGPDEPKDLFLVSLDGAGNEVWRKTFGGEEKEFVHAIRRMPDNGFLLRSLYTAMRELSRITST